MKVIFWGTCGSLPAPITAEVVREKIKKAVLIAKTHPPPDNDSLDEYIEKMPFEVRGTYGGNTSCVEIVEGDERLLCDAGTGLRDFGLNLMAEKGNSEPGAFHIFISHPHWDHIQGFPFFSPAYIPGNKIHIYGCHDELERAFHLQQTSPFFPVDFNSLEADIQFVRLDPHCAHHIAGFDVHIIEQDHPGTSYGYRFEKNGKTVVYSSDSEHRKNVYDESYCFIEFYKNADLLIFDAQYIFADSITHKENWGHSSNIIAVELAMRSGVKHLCLFHVEHTFSDAMLTQMLENTLRYRKQIANNGSMNVTMAYDGLEITL